MVFKRRMHYDIKVCVCVCMCVCVMVLKGGGVYYSVRGGGRALWY